MSIEFFLTAPGVLLDARSPGEYDQGHIPGAVNFPLFNNDERAAVGTAYKQEGRETALELGLSFIGPKLVPFLRQAKHLAPDRQVRLFCWRGGMRSHSMAQLLELADFQVILLKGGYKAFRQWVRSTLSVPKPIVTLGGMTGTGKTAVLEALAQAGQQILDLEQLANHRGSSYGNLGLPPQPTTEQFENLVALHWDALTADRPIWIEAESRGVGTCRIPIELFQQMLQAPVLELVRPRSERIQFLLDAYGQIHSQDLIRATERIRKRLGGQRTQDAIAAIQQGNGALAIELVLDYYDKTYRYDLERRGIPIQAIDVSGLDPTESARLLIRQGIGDSLLSSLQQPIHFQPQVDDGASILPSVK